MNRLKVFLAVFTLLAILYPGFFTKALSAADNDAESPTQVPRVFQGLVQQLIEDGFDETEMKNLFSSKKVAFDNRVMPRKITHNENKLHYDIFLDKKRIDRARGYLKANRKLLTSIEKEYGIPKEVKVAILLVETDLGRYLGSGLALNTLASMAVADDFQRIKPYLPPSYQKITRKERLRIERRMKKKAGWAYSELKSLIIYASLNDLDLLSMKGSIFGAIGLCQFMPSNALKFGVDYDRDGKVDLFSAPDALASMANYLRFYGWKQDIALSRQLRVIMHYNHSTPYARTVIKVAEKVRKS